MLGLIEIVFENISPDELPLLMLYLSKNGNEILSYMFSNDEGYEIDWGNIDWGNELKNRHKEYIVVGSLRALEIGELVIPNCVFRILLNEDKIDVEIAMNIRNLDKLLRNDLDSILQKFCFEVFSKFTTIKNYYAGLEPASDEDTRIFTLDNSGPMSLNNFLH